MHHLRAVSDHVHEWESYSLTDEYGIYYQGYRCTECKVAGYEVPVKDPSGAPITTRRNDDRNREDRH